MVCRHDHVSAASDYGAALANEFDSVQVFYILDAFAHLVLYADLLQKWRILCPWHGDTVERMHWLTYDSPSTI